MTTFSFNDHALHNVYLFETYMAIGEVRRTRQMAEFNAETNWQPKAKVIKGFELMVRHYIERALDEYYLAELREDDVAKALAASKRSHLEAILNDRQGKLGALEWLKQVRPFVKPENIDGLKRWEAHMRCAQNNASEVALRALIEKKFPEVKFPKKGPSDGHLFDVYVNPTEKHDLELIGSGTILPKDGA